jgi:CHAT domain-containing protein
LGFTPLSSRCTVASLFLANDSGPISIDEALKAKAGTKYLTVFLASGILLISRCDSGKAQRYSAETQSSPQELFEETLRLADTNDRETARMRLQQAMGLWVQMHQPVNAARSAIQMGDHCKHARNYGDALWYYKEALEVRSAPGEVRANALNAIATVYAELYEDDLAGHYFNQALTQARRAKDISSQMLALTGMANLYHQQGQKAKALARIEQVRHLANQKGGDTEPALLCLLGQIRQEEGLLEKAKGFFEDALATYEKAGDTTGEVRVLCALSTVSLLASHKQAALALAERAVEMAEKAAKHAASADEASNRELRWRAWLSRARAEHSLGKSEQALNSYFRAVNHFEALWWLAYISTEASSVASREEAQAAYREYVDLLMQQGQSKRAYELADEAKSRNLLNLITARRVKTPFAVNNQEVTSHELSVARLRLQLLNCKGPRQQAKLRKTIGDEEYKLREARLQNEMAHSKDRLVWSQPASAEQLQKQMARDQTVLAEFSLGEDRSFVWLFAHGDVFYAVLPPRKEIEKLVRAYLEVLAAQPSHLYVERDIAKVRGQAERLFATLFGILTSRIEPGQRLIIVPDGLLDCLPFEALIQNERYLVEDHAISYSPSASMLDLWQGSEGRGDSRHQMDLLAVGNPAFDTRFKLAGRKESTPTSLVAGALELTPLPRTQDEVQHIAGLFPAGRCKVLLGSEATEAAIKRESLGRYRRLHFASHSVVDEKSPWRSAVVLGPGGGEDGFLEASEIYELDVDCELVVLSGCLTGRGQLLSGEGIVGLARAFLYAGARSAVVSLWSVSDISTARVMKDFYQHLADGVDNVSALRSAKLGMLRSENETRHPYYWASFISIGKP